MKECGAENLSMEAKSGGSAGPAAAEEGGME